jgi:hypothetical protein
MSTKREKTSGLWCPDHYPLKSCVLPVTPVWLTSSHAISYLQACQYQQAAFCLEEALLREPGRLGLHLLYADTLYCIGGPVRARHTVLSLCHGSAHRLCQGSCQRLTQLLTRIPSRV